MADLVVARGADAVLEAVGSSEAVRLAIELVRPGGVISIAGVHHEPHFEFSPAEAYDRNLSLRIGRCPARSLMPELLPLLQRRPELASIVTHWRRMAWRRTTSSTGRKTPASRWCWSPDPTALRARDEPIESRSRRRRSIG